MGIDRSIRRQVNAIDGSRVRHQGVRMFRFGPLDFRRVRPFAIDTASILRAPNPCWTENVLCRFRDKVSVSVV